MPFLNAKSPKTPIRTDDSDIDHLLNMAKLKLEKYASRAVSDLINLDSSADRPERKEMTADKLRQLGAIPKLSFCRLENFRLMRVLGVGSYGKVFLVRLKSHRILPDALFPNRFPQLKKNAPPEAEAEFWPEGLEDRPDLCSKYWLPRTTGCPEECVFRHYFAMKVVPKHLITHHANDVSHLQTELRALRQIHHPFLVSFVRMMSVIVTNESSHFLATTLEFTTTTPAL
jgi:serine/threonine protein kinase